MFLRSFTKSSLFCMLNSRDCIILLNYNFNQINHVNSISALSLPIIMIIPWMMNVMVTISTGSFMWPNFIGFRRRRASFFLIFLVGKTFRVLDSLFIFLFSFQLLKFIGWLYNLECWFTLIWRTESWRCFINVSKERNIRLQGIQICTLNMSGRTLLGLSSTFFDAGWVSGSSIVVWGLKKEISSIVMTCLYCLLSLSIY